MLVCPQCAFENPHLHKFCQKCGASLADAEFADSDLNVTDPQGSEPDESWRESSTDLIGWALVSPASPEMALAKQPLALFPAAAVAAPGLPRYLDQQQRYQLIDPPMQPPCLTEEVTALVLDLLPEYPPTVTQMLQPELQPEFDSMDLAGDVSEGPQSGAVISIAQTYMALQAACYPACPQLYDAWETAGQVTLILENRSDWLRLSDCLHTETAPLPQILFWLHEMTELWAVLEPYGGCQSMLELSNLRVDEDQILCLQRLYIDLPGFEPRPLPPLTELGHIWQTLLNLSQDQPLGAFGQLCHDVQSGAIATVDALRLRLHTMAEQLKPDTPPTTMISESSQPLDPTSAGYGNVDAADEVFQSVGSTTPATSGPPSSAVDMSISNSPTRLEPGVLDEESAADTDDIPTVVLPMRLFMIDDAGCTDVGRQREHNEDYFSIQTQIQKLETPLGRTLQAKGLYILCDGMGGHAGGEVASALAVDTLRTYFQTHWTNQLPSEETIRNAVYQANQAIYKVNQESLSSGSGRMGTTLLMVLIHDTEAAIVHVGDSRLYRFSRRRGLEQVTLDHEVGQREIQRGVDPAIAYARPDAYQLTQALGPRDDNFISPDIQFVELCEDSLLILSSDGLTDNDLLETHWHSHIEPLLSSTANLEQGASQLIDLANHYNGHDNITAVLIRTKVRPNLEYVRAR